MSYFLGLYSATATGRAAGCVTRPDGRGRQSSQPLIQLPDVHDATQIRSALHSPDDLGTPSTGREAVASDLALWRNLVKHGDHLFGAKNAAFRALSLASGTPHNHRSICTFCENEAQRLQDESTDTTNSHNSIEEALGAALALHAKYELDLIEFGNRLAKHLEPKMPSDDFATPPRTSPSPTRSSFELSSSSLQPPTPPTLSVLTRASPSPDVVDDSPLMPMADELLARAVEDDTEPVEERIRQTYQLIKLLDEELNDYKTMYNNRLAARELLRDQEREPDTSDNEFAQAHLLKRGRYEQRLEALRARAELLDDQQIHTRKKKQKQKQKKGQPRWNDGDIAFAQMLISSSEQSLRDQATYFSGYHLSNVNQLDDISLDLLSNDAKAEHITYDRIMSKTPPPSNDHAKTASTAAWIQNTTPV